MTGPFHFNEPFPDSLIGKSAVYALLNVKTGGYYIGSSGNVYRRIYGHRSSLRRGDARNKRMQHSYSVHGDEWFYATILEWCPKRLLLDREESFLRDREGCDICYNSVRENLRSPSGSLSEETRRKMARKIREYWSIPGNRERQAENARGRKQDSKSIAKTVAAHVVPYDFTDPSGVSHKGVNRAELCRRFGLDAASMTAVSTGKLASHRGWRLTFPVRVHRPRFKLNADAVIEMRRLYLAGESRASISVKFNVSRGNVDLIVTNKTWSHVK